MGQYFSRLRQQTGLTGLAPQVPSPAAGQRPNRELSPGEPLPGTASSGAALPGDPLAGEISIIEPPSLATGSAPNTPATRPSISERPTPFSRDNAPVNLQPSEIPTVEISPLEVPAQSSPPLQPAPTDEVSLRRSPSGNPVIETVESLPGETLDTKPPRPSLTGERDRPEHPVIQISSASPSMPSEPRVTNRLAPEPLAEIERMPHPAPSTQVPSPPAAAPPTAEPPNYLQTLQAVRAWVAESVQGAVSEGQDDSASPQGEVGQLGVATAKGLPLGAIAPISPFPTWGEPAPFPVLPAQTTAQEDAPPVISIGSIQVTVEAPPEPVAPPVAPPPPSRTVPLARLSRHYIRLR